MHFHCHLTFLWCNSFRYGLYGNPFEVELFDVELGCITKPSPPSGSTTPTAIFTNVIKTGSTSATGASAGGGKEQADLFDMLVSPPEKASKNHVSRMDLSVLIALTLLVLTMSYFLVGCSSYVIIYDYTQMHFCSIIRQVFSL